MLARARSVGTRCDTPTGVGYTALVVTIDGLGDGKAATVSRFHDNRIDLVASTPSLQSPGVFFGALVIWTKKLDGRINCPSSAMMYIRYLSIFDIRYREAGPPRCSAGHLQRPLIARVSGGGSARLTARCDRDRIRQLAC